MPKYNRRREDSHIVNRIWRLARPWFHIISFIIICAFIAGSKWIQIDGYAATLADHDRRIMNVENNNIIIRQTLDDFRDYWGVPRRHK